MDGIRFNISYQEGKGRCVTANEDILEGDVLFVWKPYALVPYVTYKDRICANCLSVSMEDKFSCRENCGHVYYCSKKCEEEHWNRYHQYECSFLRDIFSLVEFGFNDEVVNYARLVTRVLTQRLNDLVEKSNAISIENVWISLAHSDKFSDAKKHEFGFISKLLTKYIVNDLLPHLIKNDVKPIDSIHVFLPNSDEVEKIHINDVDQWLVEITQQKTCLTDPIVNESMKVLLKKVFILICIEEINALFHITFKLEGYASPPQTYAMGIYPSAAFVNHSCSPNLARFPVQQDRGHLCLGDVVYFAARPIKKGEEIAYSYLERDYKLYLQEETCSTQLIQSQLIRRKKLKDEFFFECDCLRCCNESCGNIDASYMYLVKRLKCAKLACHGWFIPSFDERMICEACQTMRQI